MKPAMVLQDSHTAMLVGPVRTSSKHFGNPASPSWNLGVVDDVASTICLNHLRLLSKWHPKVASNICQF
jgi:hypothetical protein